MPKHKPPSRVRYEKSHPIIAFRLDLETKQRLNEVLEEKESAADFIKEAIGVREREKETLEEHYKKGFKKGSSEGYNLGYEHGKRDFGVYTPCAICGREMLIDSEEEMNDIDTFLRRMNLCHARCIQKREREREKMERRGRY